MQHREKHKNKIIHCLWKQIRVLVALILQTPDPRRGWENLFMSYANNKDADRPALISAFVVHYRDRIMSLVSIISIVSIFAISWLQLASIAEQNGLTGFLVTWLNCCSYTCMSACLCLHLCSFLLLLSYFPSFLFVLFFFDRVSLACSIFMFSFLAFHVHQSNLWRSSLS